MALETQLTFLMMAAVLAAFLLLHGLFRRLPFTEAVPRERFRWPVWNWYALVVGIGILFGLGANLYWNDRYPRSGNVELMEPAFTYDGGQPINDPDPHDVIEDSREIRRTAGKERSQAPTAPPDSTPAWANPGSGAAPAVTPATGQGPAWATTPLDRPAQAMESLTPIASATATATATPTASPPASPSASPSPSPR